MEATTPEELALAEYEQWLPSDELDWYEYLLTSNFTLEQLEGGLSVIL